MSNHSPFNPNMTEIIEDRQRSSLGNPEKVNAKISQARLATRQGIDSILYSREIAKIKSCAIEWSEQ